MIGVTNRYMQGFNFKLGYSRMPAVALQLVVFVHF